MVRCCILTMLAALATPAVAQPAAPGAVGAPGSATPLSLQTQLGAIPLISPRAMQQASRLRAVRLTQMTAAGQPVGEVRSFDCPETGCQHAMALELDGQPAMPFMADIQFVGRGVYLSLHAKAVEVAGVVEFEKGRRGPVFLRGNSEQAIAQTLRYALAPTATLRRLDAAAGGKAITAGNVYTRKMAPDLVMRVEIDPARERQP